MRSSLVQVARRIAAGSTAREAAAASSSSSVGWAVGLHAACQEQLHARTPHASAAAVLHASSSTRCGLEASTSCSTPGLLARPRLLLRPDPRSSAWATHASPLSLVLGSTWAGLLGPVRSCQAKVASGQLSWVRQPKSAAINDIIMPNTTQLKFGKFGIRAITSQRVAADTIEAVRRTIQRKIKKGAALWVRIQATVPVTRKPIGIRMGKGKGAIDFYATAVRPGQIIFEMDRVPRQVALQALQAAQHKFPCKLGFVEWS